MTLICKEIVFSGRVSAGDVQVQACNDTACVHLRFSGEGVVGSRRYATVMLDPESIAAVREALEEFEARTKAGDP